LPWRAVPRPSCSSEHSRQKEKRGRGGHGVPGVTSLADVILAYTQISVATSASHDGYALAVRDCPRIAAQSNQKTARAMHPLFARGLDTLLNLQVRARMPLLPRIATSSHLIPYHPRWLRFFVVSLFCRPGCGTSPPSFPLLPSSPVLSPNIFFLLLCTSFRITLAYAYIKRSPAAPSPALLNCFLPRLALLPRLSPFHPRLAPRPGRRLLRLLPRGCLLPSPRPMSQQALPQS